MAYILIDPAFEVLVVVKGRLLAEISLGRTGLLLCRAAPESGQPAATRWRIYAF